MVAVELCTKLQTICHDGSSLFEVDDVAGHEIVDVKVIGNKVVFITEKIEQKED